MDFYQIYWNSGSQINAGVGSISAYEQYHSIDYRYTFNITSTGIPASAYTFIKFTYNASTGLLYLADDWFATALPTTNDGYIYQKIGSNYYNSADYRGSLHLNNPYYKYENNGVQVWHPTSVHNHDSAYVAKSAGVTNVAWDSTNNKITKTINGTTSDVVTIATLKSALGNMPPASHDHNTLYLTAIGYDKSTKKIYYTKNGSNTNILEFAAGNNISLSTEDNKLTITNTYSATNKAASLSWGQTTTIATIGGTDITVGLPANPDNDTKVTNTLGTTTKFYITGTTTSTTNTGTQYFDTGVYVSATAGELVATKFTGALNGTANVANKLGTADKGSTTKPIYLAAGVATECSTYAGGTAVTLNGTSKAASTASFYAPTSAGSNTQILVGGTPSWIYPGISIGAGTSSAAPTIGFTTSTSSISAQSITIASTSVYGVTKLQDGVSSNSTTLAATANAAKTASTSATHTLATTTKFFVTGCTSSTTNTAGDDFDTGVYVTTTAGEISALRHSWHDPSNSPVEKAYSYWNPDNQSIDFVFN